MNRDIDILHSFRFVLSAVVLLSLSLSACAGRNGAGSGSSDMQNVDTTGYETVPMPEIPSSLVTPEERADYLLRHFWDALDFGNVSIPKDSVKIEQSFSNFLSLMPIVSHDEKMSAVKILMDRASESKPAYDFIADLADKYLWEADSPFYSEESFLPFVEYYIANDASRKQLALYIKEEIAMNAPGSIAPDFKVADAGGHPVTFYGLLAQKPVVLMFYQPDCDHCHNVIDGLRNDARFMKSVEDGDFIFAPVYIGDDKEGWLKHAATLPDSWRVMIDETEYIDNNDLYLVKSTPSFYVVGKDRKIILKDATPSLLMNCLYH